MRKKVGEDTKICRIRWKEREREEEKTQVKRRISNEEQREKEVHLGVEYLQLSLEMTEHPSHFLFGAGYFL